MTRTRLAVALAAAAAVALVLAACDLLPTGYPGECAGVTPTTATVDCSWASTTTTTDPSAPTTEALPQPPTFDGRGPKMAVLGDSITQYSAAAIHDAMVDAGFSVSVYGGSGATVVDADRIVAWYATARPDYVIVELGTNGTQSIAEGTPPWSVDFYGGYLEMFQSRFPGACFVVTTITTHRDVGEHPPDFDAAAQAEDDWLFANFPYRVLDWNTYEYQQRQAGNWLVDPTDEIHPKELPGQLALAALDVGAARSCRDRVPVTIPDA